MSFSTAWKNRTCTHCAHPRPIPHTSSRNTGWRWEDLFQYGWRGLFCLFCRLQPGRGPLSRASTLPSSCKRKSYWVRQQYAKHRVMWSRREDFGGRVEKGELCGFLRASYLETLSTCSSVFQSASPQVPDTLHVRASAHPNTSPILHHTTRGPGVHVVGAHWPLCPCLPPPPSCALCLHQSLLRPNCGGDPFTRSGVPRPVGGARSHRRGL